MPEIEVAFHIDANGILHVSAQDLTTAARREVTIEAIAALSPDEIKRMVIDSQTHEREDSEFLRQYAERQQAAVLRDKLQSFLTLHGGEIDAAEVAEMHGLLERFSSAVEAGDAISIEETRTRILEAIQPHSDLFYIHSMAKQEGGGHEAATERAPSTASPAEAQTLPGAESGSVAVEPEAVLNLDEEPPESNGH